MKYRSKLEKYTQRVLLCLLIVLLIFMLCSLSSIHSLFSLFLLLGLYAFVFFINKKLLGWLKKKSFSAMVTALLCFGCCLLSFFIGFSTFAYGVLHFNWFEKQDSSLPTVDVVLSENVTHTYVLHQDTLPLLISDLYPLVSHPHYSYEKQTSKTFLMKQTNFSQAIYPMKNPPPEIYYTVIDCTFPWTFQIALENLIAPSEFLRYSWVEIPSSVFHADFAYARLNREKEPSGQYIFCYNSTIVTLSLEEPLTQETTPIVVEKLTNYLANR